MATNEPIRKFQAGPVACALWGNMATIKGKQQMIPKATVDRRYLGKDGQWKTSGSFSERDIPLAIYGLIMAFITMIEMRRDATDSNEAVEEERGR